MAPANFVLVAAAALTGSAFAQTKYGENHVRVNLDSDMVEQGAFPAPNVTLLSPAFLPNATFVPGWFDGSDGATGQSTLSMRWHNESVKIVADRSHRQFRSVNCVAQPVVGVLSHHRVCLGRGPDFPTCVPINLQELDKDGRQIEGLVTG